MLKVESLSKTYETSSGKPVSVLSDINLSIDGAEFVTIMGPSGSGKSTLLQLIGSLDRPTGGRILVNGADLSSLDEMGRTLFRRRKLGFVFQAFHLIPLLTAEENVALPLVLDGTSRGKALERARALLGGVVGLGQRGKHRPGQLSGGEKQRVAIARALIANPDLILADEPTGALDSATSGEILALLKSLRSEQGRTILMVTHDETAARYGTRIIRLRDGRMVADGKPA
ncbi:MAG: ABC transporter ATP-binding protein [Deltaproteobacteria bacterium]|nr:ABC transporter ATP-binding protein [Deltaproteobacteria bacterium]